jgi:hypothetical protein
MKLLSVSLFPFSHHFLHSEPGQVGTATVQRGSFCGTGREFSVLQTVQTIHTTHPASYSVLTFDCFSEGKMAGA